MKSDSEGHSHKLFSSVSDSQWVQTSVWDEEPVLNLVLVALKPSEVIYSEQTNHISPVNSLSV